MSFFQIAAAAIGAIGNIYAGNAQAAQYEAQGNQAAMNARITRAQSSAEEDTTRRQHALTMGEIRARAVETGFDPSSGSLLSLQTKSAGELELDALTQRYRGELQAISLQNEARAYKASASSARRSGYLNAAGYVAASGASYYGQPRIGPPAPVSTAVGRSPSQILGLNT